MLSDAQRESIAVIFASLDATGDGLITREDALTMADQLCAGLAVEEGSQAYGEIQAAYRQLWDELMRFADADGNSAVDVEEFLGAVDRGMLEDPEFIDRAMLVVSHALFTGTDTNGDGVIDLEEYARMITTVDASGYEMARAGFEMIDTDRDGAISRDEFIAAMRELFYGSDFPDGIGDNLLR